MAFSNTSIAAPGRQHASPHQAFETDSLHAHWRESPVAGLHHGEASLGTHWRLHPRHAHGRHAARHRRHAARHRGHAAHRRHFVRDARGRHEGGEEGLRLRLHERKVRLHGDRLLHCHWLRFLGGLWHRLVRSLHILGSGGDFDGGLWAFHLGDVVGEGGAQRKQREDPSNCAAYNPAIHTAVVILLLLLLSWRLFILRLCHVKRRKRLHADAAVSKCRVEVLLKASLHVVELLLRHRHLRLNSRRFRQHPATVDDLDRDADDDDNVDINVGGTRDPRTEIRLNRLVVGERFDVDVDRHRERHDDCRDDSAHWRGVVANLRAVAFVVGLARAKKASYRVGAHC
mmetsp:Transcript_5403/g.10879  ORF Transcript_5403/g.10879 Transcript_5403/m.10879 type:complete len:343 (-) Transcript_5403:2920-3948(-)